MKKKVLIGAVVAAIAGVVVGILACNRRQFCIADYLSDDTFDGFDEEDDF